MKFRHLLGAALLATLPGVQAAEPPATAPAAAPAAAAPAATPAPLKTVAHDRVLIAGQPGEIDLKTLREQGVTTIFNLRTEAEMSDRSVVPYDEAALAKELDLAYVQEPIGGTDHPFRPEVLEAFKAELDRSQGKLLLHCGTGGRAGLVYAAYAVKYLGQEPDEAMRSLEALGGWPLPLERLTGIPLKVERRGTETADR